MSVDRRMNCLSEKKMLFYPFDRRGKLKNEKFKTIITLF